MGPVRIGLIGMPLTRRHSQVMHAAALRSIGREGSYELRELRADAMAGFVEEVRRDGWTGFQVTAPHKQAIVEHCDVIEADARHIGAVNTVVVEDGALIGTNTDAPGFASAVHGDLGTALRGARVVVIGAGGAARAVVRAAAVAGAARVDVRNRTAARASALAADLSAETATPIVGGAHDGTARDVLGAADLVVNASTVGMGGGEAAIDVSVLPSTCAVFDCVYVPADTPLVVAARRRGLRAVNGAGMLVGQAVVAFERFTGRGDVADVMRAAVDPLLADPVAQA